MNIFAEGRKKGIELRYGENPHEEAYVYGSLAFQLLHEGRKISYNNILDADAAWTVTSHVKSLAPYTATVVKHQTPCGVSIGDDPIDVIERTIHADLESSYGGILAVSFPMSLDAAKSIKRYLEVIVAPDFDDDARSYLKKKKVRLIKPLPYTSYTGKPAFGGFLVSQRIFPSDIHLEQVVGGEVSDELIMDVKLAYGVVEGVKSNAIVLVKDGVTVGIGTGQPSRKRAAWIATTLAGDKANGAVAASDAFFPFPDGLEILAEAGVVAVVAPLGSKRDKEVLEAAEKLGIAFFRADIRVFRH